MLCDRCSLISIVSLKNYSFPPNFALKDFFRRIDDLVLVQLVLLALVADLGHVDGVTVRGDGQVVGACNVLKNTNKFQVSTGVPRFISRLRLRYAVDRC